MGPRVFQTAALLAVGFILISLPIYAQNEEPPADQGSAIDQSSRDQSSAMVEGTAALQEEAIFLGETPSQEITGGGASIWIVLRMVLVLALAALAIYGVVFFIKRLARPPQSRDPHLKVLASVPLGGDSFAAVVSVGTRAWLVGGGSGAGISLISEIEEQEALESMLLDEAQRSAETAAHRFPDFRSLLSRFGNIRQQELSLNTHADTLRRQRGRLKGIQP